ncbi:signal peptidase I [Paenibacillus sp. GCM10023252]|uniref:signal peptidase I n=1 Tax=Paenibacillus sp. GCM10023252 TaxID=3252649 RepID=UPI00361E7927
MNHPEARQARPRWVKELMEWTMSLTIAIVAALLIQTYVYAQSEVQNISMQNTLVAGQRLIEDKWSYRFTTPKHGDIIIINGPESELRLIKRVIALPGDELDMRDGLVYLNGQKLDEPYVKGLTFAEGMKMPYKVSHEQVFVMGDNRENSQDSRVLGPIHLSSVEGKAVLRIWPLNKFGALQ